MQLQDFLHHYTGCEVEINAPHRPLGKPDPHANLPRRGQFLGYTDNKRLSARIGFRAGPPGVINLQYVTPRLIPPTKITADHVKGWADAYFSSENTGWKLTTENGPVELESEDDFGTFIEIMHDGSITAKTKDDGETRPFDGGGLVLHLLAQRIDLFGAIPAGLAVDVTINNQPFKSEV